MKKIGNKIKPKFMIQIACHAIKGFENQNTDLYFNESRFKDELVSEKQYC